MASLAQNADVQTAILVSLYSSLILTVEFRSWVFILTLEISPMRLALHWSVRFPTRLAKAQIVGVPIDLSGKSRGEVTFLMVIAFQPSAIFHIPTVSLDSSAPAPMDMKNGSRYCNILLRENGENYLEFVIRSLVQVRSQIIKMVQAAAALMVTMEQFISIVRSRVMKDNYFWCRGGSLL